MSVVISEPVAGLASAPPPENWLGAWETSADCAYCRTAAGRAGSRKSRRGSRTRV